MLIGQPDEAKHRLGDEIRPGEHGGHDDGLGLEVAGNHITGKQASRDALPAVMMDDGVEGVGLGVAEPRPPADGPV